jgi:hypothetical protein
VNGNVEPHQSSDNQQPSRPRLGLARLVAVAIVVWFAVGAVSFVLDLAHRVLVLLALAGAAFLCVKLSRTSRS